MNFNIFEESRKAEKELINRVKEGSNRIIFGTYKGYRQWDLAVSWFQMSNDGFFNLYGFNFVPKGRLFTEAKNFVHNK